MTTNNAIAVDAAAVPLVARLRSKYRAWARACYIIRDKLGQHVPFELNDGQRAVGRLERHLLDTIGQARIFILKARQGGFSTDQQARALWQIWREPGFDALTLAYTKEDTEKLFNITQRAIEHFPPALLPRLADKATNQIGFPGLDTILYTGTAGSKRTGRGLTIKRFHGSEFAFWNDPEGTLATVGGGIVPVGSSVVLETTASGFDSPAHNFYREAKAKGYTTIFVPWWDCDRKHYRRPLLAPDELAPLTDEETALMQAHGLDLEQIKWRREKIAEFGRLRFLTEYAEDDASCWMTVGGMFFDAEMLKALLLDPPVPLRTELAGALRIYVEPEDVASGARVIGGADTAEGGAASTEHDRSTIYFEEFPSGRLLAEYEDRGVTPKEFAGVLNAWGRRYKTALLVVEKNAHGITVLRELRDTHLYPLGSIYHRSTIDDAQNEKLDRIGWATTAESKPVLLDACRDALAAAARGDAGRPTAGVVRDAFGVRRGVDGKYDLNGKDLLVARGLAWIGRTAPSDTGIIGYYAKLAEAKRKEREAQQAGTTTRGPGHG